jgi:hypothetical protein
VKLSIFIEKRECISILSAFLRVFRTRILQHYAVVIPAIDGMTTICISLSAVIAARLPIVVR